MTLPAPKRCKCCGQPIDKTPARWCRKCKRLITRHDKWHITKLGLEHKCCENPGHYMSKAEYRAAYGHDPY